MNDDDGYRIWLGYEPVADSGRARELRDAVTHLVADADSPPLAADSPVRH